jgi:ADP-dependent NAD(P)H-hydrate dehydratase
VKPKPLGATALRRHPLPPVADDDKQSKGRMLVIAGSRDIPGAALLAATAAMRAGAGKLRIATVRSAAPQLAVAMPEAMVVGLPEARDGGFSPEALKRIDALAESADAIIAGPGVKSNAACPKIASSLLRARAPVALDVAFLKSLPRSTSTDQNMPVLLPNADELSTLLGCGRDEVEKSPVECGRAAAERYNAVVLVKGVASHVVTADGRAWRYDGGAPGLGVSGSGDVLAGIVGGLLARGGEPLNALLWAVWLHGQAGAALAKKVGPIGFLAREIAAEIPALLPG